MRKKISVVIGTYNLKDKLKLTLNSFEKQSFEHDSFEVIVVDSESNDGTEEWFKKNKFSFELKYIRQKNEGKASARNRGIAEASAEVVLITDADMLADENLIKEHYKIQQEHNFSVLIEGKTWVLKEERLPATEFLRRPYITHKVKHCQKLDFYYCLTGNLSFPKEFFIKYGGFDETFKNYGWEDVAFGYELIKKRKQTLIYSEKAINYHFHVWNDYQEILRREDMGKSVHLIINKYPDLKYFLGINIANKFIYLFLKWNTKLKDKWLKKLKKDIRFSKWKKILLREYFFQKGYLNEKKYI